jgi:hypothetical protein
VTVDREFFLSFTGADQPWAEWLLAELDAAGYSSVSQLRDFVAGSISPSKWTKPPVGLAGL